MLNTAGNVRFVCIIRRETPEKFGWGVTIPLRWAVATSQNKLLTHITKTTPLKNLTYKSYH